MQAIAEMKTPDLMAEAKQLHDLIYNVECYGTRDMLRLELIYRELERRGWGVVEANTVTFVESIISTN